MTPSRRPRRPLPGRLGIAAVTAFIALPLLLTVVTATSVDAAKGPWGGGVTGDWFRQGFAEIGPMLVRSLVVAVIVTIANLVVGGGLAFWIARRRTAATRIVRQLMNLPMAVPGIALSIGLVTLYPTLRPSGVLLACGHLLLTLPFTLAALVPALSDDELIDGERVAATLGAGPADVLLRLTAPTALIASIQTLMMVFAISFGEFNISFFVDPPAISMAPFALFDAFSTQRIEVSSAETALFLIVLVPVLGAFLVLRHVLSPRKATS